MKLVALSLIVCSGRVGLLTLIWMIGTLEALYWMINGGVIPGGRGRRTVWLIDVIWATAEGMLAFGWKKTLITLSPLRD